MKKNHIIVIVLCIIVAVGSFISGIAYQYNRFKDVQCLPVGSISETDITRYYFEYRMPLTLEKATEWLTWAGGYHQVFLDEELYPNKVWQEYHRDWFWFYESTLESFIELDNKWKGGP